MPRAFGIVLAVVAIAILTAHEAAAAVRFDPPEPVSGEPFRIVYDGIWRDSCVPTSPRLEVFDRYLFVTFEQSGSEGCLAALTPFTATIEGVRLSGADYSLLTRVDGERLEPLFGETSMRVSGAPAPIYFSPSFDATAGNRLVTISGSFPCNTSPCSPPEVLFGSNRSPDVRRSEVGFIYAVVPPGEGLVDVSVRGETYTHTKVSGFQYVVRDDWEALLLPVYTRSAIDGAYGSRWITEWSILNQNEEPLIVNLDLLHVDESCVVTCPGTPPLYPDYVDSSLRLIVPPAPGGLPVALVHVRKEAVDHVTGSLRTRDLTRQSESWGCEIPIVRESEMGSVVTLVDVPREDRFRQKLRIYDPRLPNPSVKVEFFETAGPRLLTRDIALGWPNGSQGGVNPPGFIREGSLEFPLQPAYAEIDLASIPELEGHPRIWIRVSTSGAGKIWAFVSITNDETQQVSTVTPQ